jgi:hypothetical protein
MKIVIFLLINLYNYIVRLVKLKTKFGVTFINSNFGVAFFQNLKVWSGI